MGSLRTLQNGKLTTSEKAIRNLFTTLPASTGLLIVGRWCGGRIMGDFDFTIDPASLDDLFGNQQTRFRSDYTRRFNRPQTVSELVTLIETAERDIIRLARVEWDVPGQHIKVPEGELDGFEIVADIEQELRFQWPGGIIRIPTQETLEEVEQQIAEDFQATDKIIW